MSVVSLSAAAEKNDCSSCTIYKGYISGDISAWKQGMKEMQAEYERTKDACILYSMVEARYGYIGYMLGRGRKSEVKPLVDAFDAEIEKLSAYPSYRAETEAFRVALLGYRMGLNPARVVSLGPRALKQLEKAIEAGSSCAAVWIEKANSESYMPAFAGGSGAKAAESFRTALKLFESDPNLSKCNWRYLNTMVMLGQLLEKMDDLSGAREAYLKALSIEPSFQWVRDELLPALDKKTK